MIDIDQAGSVSLERNTEVVTKCHHPHQHLELAFNKWRTAYFIRLPARGSLDRSRGALPARFAQYFGDGQSRKSRNDQCCEKRLAVVRLAVRRFASNRRRPTVALLEVIDVR